MVSIGHVTWDAFPGQRCVMTPGGAAAFATVTARRQGIDAGIVTAAGQDYPCDEVAPPEARSIVTSDITTTFENRYDSEGVRHQRLITRASAIELADVPEDWRNPDILFVGPLTQELPPDCLHWFTPRVSCVVPQGWCRYWESPLPARVNINPMPPVGMSTGWDICVASEQEVEGDTLRDWLAIADHVAITHGERGATLHRRGATRAIHIPAATHIQDAGTETTGAGDVFAAALAISYANGAGIVQSAHNAAEWAARSTTAPGWHGI